MSLRPLILVLSVLGLGLAGCETGLVDDPSLFCPSNPQAICYTDSDCVPADCCGMGSCSVHVDDAPQCSNVRCEGSCDPNTTDCGCGLPVCRDGTCTVARTTGDGC